LDQIRYWQKLILTEDLNARVEITNRDEIIERFSETMINNSGDIHASSTTWKSVIHSSNIKTYTNMYRKDHGRRSQKWIIKSIIDYIITRQRAAFKIQNDRVKRGLNCGSDHYAVTNNIYFAAETISTAKHSSQKSWIIALI